MVNRKVIMSGVLTKQSRLAKLRFDLKRRKENGSLYLSGEAREKVMVQMLDLQDQLSWANR